MPKSDIWEKINKFEVKSNANRSPRSDHVFDFIQYNPKRRRNHVRPTTINNNYQLVIKPRLHRSSSLSDLATNASDYALDFLKHAPQSLLFDTSGDADIKYQEQETKHMSWSIKGKKNRKKSISMSPEKNTTKYDNNGYTRITRTIHSSDAEDSSLCSVEPLSNQTGSAFPFKCTPSGNLKVQSNQVVFQSSTVGVILADPSQAKVKVKFEGKPTGDGAGEFEKNSIKEEGKSIRQTNFQVYATKVKTDRSKFPEKAKAIDLESLGYATAEPVDWHQVQLPLKQDLMKDFLRRVQNYLNTDTIVHIGDEDFHCHHIILEVYSYFFNTNMQREIELPMSSVTPQSFQTIYDWMHFSDAESNKVLTRENILDLFVAAQYLEIKDLEEQCWSFIVNEKLFTEDTAFKLYREARRKDLNAVVDLMVPRIMKFFLPLVASKDFLDLEPEEVMTFLRSNYICITSEMEVLMAGVRWLFSNWTERRQYVVEVAKCVRFGLISPWQLVDIKRNPDNEEILEVVNESEVQQMVDDGLAYVIIQYWYGNNSKNYYHWIEVLGLSEPAERNWIGEEKNHITYKDFLKYLEGFLLPKQQMYDQMSLMQPATRKIHENAGTLRDSDNGNDMKRPKFDFPLPQTLKDLNDKKDTAGIMSDFFAPKNKSAEETHVVSAKSNHKEKSPKHRDKNSRKVSDELKQQVFQIQGGLCEPKNKLFYQCNERPPNTADVFDISPSYEPPEKDSNENFTTNTETSSDSPGTSAGENIQDYTSRKRHSVAATYLAAATAALAGTRAAQNSHSASVKMAESPRSDTAQREDSTTEAKFNSPQISLFRDSKEIAAKRNMNKLSTSILGPSNKNYMLEGSLFNWDRETVLVFGGIDPHTTYGTGRNIGKEIIRFDPVANLWECVGELPEPRHHHAVAFLRGRVYLVGGADPRDDDVRGKSVVVSTVWSYEPVTKSWFSENGLAIPRKNFGLVVHRMALYAIGGQDKKGRVLRSVEKFDPKTGFWSEVRHMNIARMAVAATKYREYIWVAGGMTGEKNRPLCKVVECYNSKTNEWTEIHNLRFPRCFATLFSMNDKLFLVGGAGKLSDKEKSASSVGAVDVWEWKGRQWREHAELSIPRHGHALAYLGTQLIIIGGVTTIYMRALNNVESYCCEREAWIRGVSALPTPLSGHGAVTLPPASLL